MTTLFQIPYGVIIALGILTCVFINDRLPRNNRCKMAILFLLPSITGAFGLRFLPQTNKVARLIMYYLTGPQQASFVLVLSMVTANTAGHTKKIITSATVFLGVCGGSIAGPFFYKESQKPGYRDGFISMIVGYDTFLALCSLLQSL